MPNLPIDRGACSQVRMGIHLKEAKTVRSGLLVIDKPAGVSSRDCVNHVQRALRNRKIKVGHAGTLDPMATGVLLVAVGEATRLVEYLHDLDKSYAAEFEFGKSSDTLDREGEITLWPDAPQPTPEQLAAACQRWIGPVMQRPPRYSAIKINGQRAYDLARSGAEFEPEARCVRIDRLAVTAYEYPHWSFELDCGSGTYVRSLGRDIAQQLDNAAIMTALVRTAIGPFTLHDAHPLAHFEHPAAVEDCLRSPLEGLPQWPRAVVDARQAAALRNGQAIDLS
ncbi:MAG: tRNA pseudouridine(55) synthase TruB, partial [Aureliella sp.]